MPPIHQEPQSKASQRACAVITGASSGIGRAFAFHLAAAGYDLLLVARREARLQAICNELSQTFAIDCRYAVLDLSVPQQIEQLAQQLTSTKTAEILVNNAGFSTLGEFSESDPLTEQRLLNLQVLAPQRLCRAILPEMIQQQRGIIINVASIAALALTPRHVNYNAGKAYLIAFSQSLAEEVARDHIQVQALCPGYTRSEFHQQAAFADFRTEQVPALFWMQPEEVVAASLKALKRNRVVVIPGWINQLLVWAFTRAGLRNLLLGLFRQRTR